MKLAVKLLGRPPRTPFRIETRCADDTPQVLLADPVFLEDFVWKPFPTFLWLVCPRLCKAVARLEQEGYIAHFSERLKDDSQFYEEFKTGQIQVINYRLKLALKSSSSRLPDYINEVLSTTSITGSKDWIGVKCLHSHVAQELVFANNPIGKAILDMTGRCISKVSCLKADAF